MKSSKSVKPSIAHAKNPLNFSLTALVFSGVSTMVLAWTVLLAWFFILAFQNGLSATFTQAQLRAEQEKIWITTLPAGWLGTPISIFAKIEQSGEALAQQLLSPEWVAQAGQQLKTGLTVFPTNEPKGFGAALKRLQYQGIQIAGLILMVTELMALKLIQLVSALPLFVLAGFIGFIEGLVRRDLRRCEAGRESAFLFHKAYVWGFRLMMTGIFVFCLATLTISAQAQLCILAMLLGFWIYQTSSRFKKYV